MSTAYRFEMKPLPDGLGFYYGFFKAGDRQYRIDILPPATTHPRPYFTKANAPADPKMWIVYIDGEEVARIKSREELPKILVTRLLEHVAQHHP